MEKEDFFKELTTLQWELNNYLQATTKEGETACRIRYEVSAIVMRMIREGGIHSKEALRKTTYKLINESLAELA